MKIISLITIFIWFNFICSGQQWREKTEDWNKFTNYLELSKNNFYKSTAKSIEFGKRAVQLAKKWDDEINIAIAGLYLAKGYELIGYFDKAFGLYFESLAVFQKDQSEIDIAYTLDAIGNLYYCFCNTKKALEYFERALEIYSKDMKSWHYARVLNHIGLVCEVEGKTNKAFDAYQEALKISLENKDSLLLSAIYHNLGILYFNSGDLNKAQECYCISMKYSNKEESGETAILYLNLARLYLKKDDYKRVKKYMYNAERICRKSGIQYLLPAIFFNYYLFYEKTGVMDKSFFYYKKFTEAEKEILSSEKQLRVNNIRTDFLISEKDRKIRKLYLKRKDLNSITGQYKITITILLGTIIIGFVILYYFINDQKEETLDLLKKSKKDKNKTSVKKYSHSVLGKKEKIEIAKKIEILFEEEKIFIKKNLTLTELSVKLGISRTYTSQVINEVFKKTFTKLVNEYRVKEAGKLMKLELYQLYTIESIANEVGFNSTNVFSRVFKEFYGQTPSMFFKERIT